MQLYMYYSCSISQNESRYEIGIYIILHGKNRLYTSERLDVVLCIIYIYGWTLYIDCV